MSESADGAISEPRILQFGPRRVIGMSYKGRNEHEELKALWDGENQFLARMAEIERSPGDGTAYGLCRCIPGATDGSFEYIAALPVAVDAPIPEGMIEAPIGEGTYAEFAVASLAELPAAWARTHTWVKAHPEWAACCGPSGCDCASHPFFELYPPDFGKNGQLFVYVPIREKE